MVIETAVVGSLGLHILSNFRKGTSAGGNLPLEKLQLSAALLHPITTPIPLDGPTLSQGEADLEEAEGLGEGDYLIFPLIHPDAHCLKTTHNLAGEFLQFFNDELTVPPVKGGMGSIREEALQVQQEHSPLAAIPAEMPVKLLLQSAVCPVEPLPSIGGPPPSGGGMGSG